MEVEGKRERRRPVNATKPASSKPGPKFGGTKLM